MTREDLTDKAGYQRSSRDRYIYSLINRRLVEALSGGKIIASKKLFE